MRFSYANDPVLSGKVFDLLETAFPGLRRAVAEARQVGCIWEDVSTPFVHFEGERALSHVGLIDLPLRIAGRNVNVGSVHAVATHPDYRRRGLFRNLMEELFRYCEGRYETLILSTENPEYYEPFGFRRLQEHFFTVRGVSSGGADDLRLLDPRRAPDMEILNRLLARRTPVSEVVGVRGERTVFLFNEGNRPIHYAEDLDVVLCMEREGANLGLFDVVGETIPELPSLLARVPEPVETVTLHFAPDRIAAAAEPTPYVVNHYGPSYLMVRGPFEVEGEPFTLPRSART